MVDQEPPPGELARRPGAFRERARWLAGRVGHRGAALLCLGAFDELYASGITGAANTSAAAGQWLAYVAPLDLWAALWAVAGLVLITGAFCVRDTLAFGTAMALKCLWALLYLLGWTLHGVDRGWIGAATWTAFAALVYVVSAWPERIIS